MGLGWRTAFCTSISKDKILDSPIINEKPETNPNPSPKLSNRFIGFFSQPTTPRFNESIPSIRCRTVTTTNSAPSSPRRLHCKTKSSQKIFNRSSTTPSSPRSPPAFPLLSKSKCGICSESVKTGQGTAIFTAECGHSFHFPCVATHVKKQCALTCPMCSSTWKEMHMFEHTNHSSKSNHQNHNSKLKVYNDDEPLSSPTCGARFNPIFESDESMEEDENNEFPGFFTSKTEEKTRTGNLDISLLPETAVVSVGKATETYAVVLKIKAPSDTLRKSPVDVVTVLNVSRSITREKMQLMKKTMRLVVSSLSATDRLSIVAYSSTSKRLLPLRRMNPSGKRAARRIIDAVVALDAPAASIMADSLKKAAKVIEDRRECNPTASILLFSDGTQNSPVVSSTFSTTDIQVHSISLNTGVNVEGNDALGKRVCNMLSVVGREVQVRLGFKSGSAPGEISAIYSNAGRAELLGSGSDWCRVGDLYSQEEKELLIELKVPSSFVRAHTLLSVGYSYKDPSTQQNTYDKELTLSVPRPRATGTSTREMQRVRCLFVSTRAIAESRRLLERGDVVGAHRMLSSSRALVLQSGSGVDAEFIRGLDAELANVDWKGRDRVREQCRRETREEDKSEPLTPTSAWRAAERLAKVAIMRKSLNRVSDLHGFEDARF